MATPNRLRVVRTERGLNIKALAQAAGVSRQTIYNIEAAERQPDLDTLRKLAEALDVTIADLLSDPLEAAS